jgi:hypothetical protein
MGDDGVTPNFRTAAHATRGLSNVLGEIVEGFQLIDPGNGAVVDFLAKDGPKIDRSGMVFRVEIPDGEDVLIVLGSYSEAFRPESLKAYIETKLPQAAVENPAAAAGFCLAMAQHNEWQVRENLALCLAKNPHIGVYRSVIAVLAEDENRCVRRAIAPRAEALGIDCHYSARLRGRMSESERQALRDRIKARHRDRLSPKMPEAALA